MFEPITFKIVDPNALPGDYKSAEDPGPFVRLTEDGIRASLDQMADIDEIVIPEGEIKTEFVYALEESHIITLHSETGFFTRGKLAEEIASKYQQIYEEEKTSSTILPETFRERNLRESGEFSGLPNRVNTNGKWGVWGHELEDLLLSCVRYDWEKDVYNLDIFS